jgi:hypothetical protein
MLFDKQKQDILGKLIIDNQDLEKLESMVSEFNIFESIGVVRQEIRHSHFVAFLLNPSKNHGLGDVFLKKFLIYILHKFESLPLNPVDIDIANLQDVEVWTEWRNIDILIYSRSNNLACAIENKVDSTEHSNQLNRYREIVCKEFPECRKILLYLTKDGDIASTEKDENSICTEKWLSLAHGEVADMIEVIHKKYQSTIGNEVYTVMNHYVNLVKRHIVSDSEIALLCQKIYKQHRQALDLIYEHRPDIQMEISDFIQQFIKSNVEQGIKGDYSDKKYIRFLPIKWDTLDSLKVCTQWTPSKHIVLFEFVNQPQYLNLDLVVAPGDIKLKQAIVDALRDLNIFKKEPRVSDKGYNHIYVRKILNSSDYVDGDLESLQEKIKDFWKKHLPEIEKIGEAIFNLQVNQSG